MIDQTKIGGFLKSLRKEKGRTQEEIAELFGVSSRSVSRWECGRTMPDLSILVELADYYDVDIRELIDGERKSEKMEKETKETLLRVADYAEAEKKKSHTKSIVIIAVCCGLAFALMVSAVCCMIYAFTRQYNPKGISSMITITIDEERPREYIGELDGYSIYTEKLKTEALYFKSFTAQDIYLSDAISQKLVSVDDWRRKAWDTIRSGDTEILRYENYEIAITGQECVIRPITDIHE